MATYDLTTTIRTDAGRNVWFPIESDLTIEQLRRALAADGCVLVTRLETDRRGSSGTVRVVARTPFLVGAAGLAMIAPSRLELIEAAS